MVEGVDRMKPIKNVCVLGSDGQIGRPLCEKLKSLGYSVTEIDVKHSNKHDLSYMELDSPVYAKTIESITSSDFVFFLAFDVGGANYLSTEDGVFEFISYNVKLMNNTFEILEKGKNPFVFASSMMAARSEESNYGFLKKLGERYTTSLGGLNVRMWNVFGHQRWDGKSNVITEVINQVLMPEIKEIKLMSSGQESRDFMYVDDCVEAFIVMMNNYESLLKTRSNSVHLSTGRHMVTVKEVANMISKIHKDATGEHKEVVPKMKHVFTHSVFEYLPKNECLLDSSLWSSEITLNEGLKKLYTIVSNEKKTNNE